MTELCTYSQGGKGAFYFGVAWIYKDSHLTISISLDLKFHTYFSSLEQISHIFTERHEFHHSSKYPAL